MEILYSERLTAWLTIWHEAVKKKEASAQFALASLYMAIKRETAAKKAFDWYKAAARQGYTDAVYMVGRCYETGTGIRKSYVQALQWYKVVDANICDDLLRYPDPIGEAAKASVCRYFADEEWAECIDIDEIIEDENSRQEDSFAGDKEAAESGEAEAQNRLGHRYYYGRDTEQDMEKAVYWYRKSAEQGCEAGMKHLADHYEREKRYKEAAVWYRRYAELRILWRNQRLGWENPWGIECTKYKKGQ